MNLEQKKFADKWLGKIQITIAGIVVVFGAALSTVPSKWGEVVGSVLMWAQGNAWWVVAFGPIGVGIIQFLRRKYCNPWAMNAIQKILDEFQVEIFGELDDPVDYHKITLFKKKRFKLFHWPPIFDCTIWQGWLVPVARSEHLAKKRIDSFPAPDAGDDCKGIAGKAWRYRDWVYVPAEGENPLPVLGIDSTEDEIRNYAERTCVQTSWVNARISSSKAVPQSFAALQVQLAGEPWGVLVIDSRSSMAIDVEKLRRFRAYGNLLTPLLERI